MFLFLLAALPLLGGAAFAWRRRAAARLAKLSRHAQTVPPRSCAQLWLVLGALGAAIVALAGPRWGRSVEETLLRGRNVMLAVDVSRSMLAEDVHPNRLGRAKSDLIDLVDGLQGDRAGLLAFRGKGALLCPMTADKAFLRQSIESLDIDSAPPGETDLADAIAKCLVLFDQTESGHNAIVLVSDGEDLAGRAEALARQAGERNIPIFTVGIGSAQGATIPDGGGVLLHEGETVRSRLTERTLEAIATASRGRYVPLATASTAQTTLGAIYARYLAQLADREERERIEQAFTDRSGLFALVAAALAILAALLSLGRVGGRRRVALALLILLGAPAARAQEPARDAQRAYRRGDYPAAAEAYKAARVGAEPAEAAHYAYNQALALWKSGDATNALAAVRLAAGDRVFAGRAATLEGTLLMGQEDEAESPEARLVLRLAAVDAFSRALLEEDSVANRRNLARAQDGVGRLRADVRRAAALAKHKDKQLGQIIPEILFHQRALAKAAPEVFTLADAQARLLQSGQLAEDVRAQADRWYPVLEALPQAVTNEALRLELTNRTTAAQAALDAAAARYEEVRGDVQPLAEGEPFVYDFWKLIADPPALNAEAIAVQTNALTSLTRYQPARDDEEEVLNLVQQFRMLFPQWAEEQLRQQQAQTNDTAVVFTEADRDLIARTADATVPLLAPPVSPENRQIVMDNLLLIREHLPKRPPPPQPQQNQQQQQQKPQSRQQEQQAQETQPQQSEEEAKEQEAQALLQRAADREREHEEEKRRAARSALPANARDW